MKINSPQKDSNTESNKVNIFDIAEFSPYDGPGLRTVVYFQGCNAHCDWCHSPQSQKAIASLMFNKNRCTHCRRCVDICNQYAHSFVDKEHKIKRENCTHCGECIDFCPNSIAGVGGSALHLPTVATTVDCLFNQIYPYISLVKKSGGITLSGGEALLQLDAAKELLQKCKASGIHTAVETSGLLPISNYLEVAPLVDIWLFGMRVITGKNHPRHDKHIHSTLKSLIESGAKVLPRIPMIPGFFDRDDVLQSIGKILSDNNIDSVCLNPWNGNYDVNYTKSGLDLNMPKPTLTEIELCETKIITFFSSLKLNAYENKF